MLISKQFQFSILLLTFLVKGHFFLFFTDISWTLFHIENISILFPREPPWLGAHAVTLAFRREY